MAQLAGKRPRSRVLPVELELRGSTARAALSAPASRCRAELETVVRHT